MVKYVIVSSSSRDSLFFELGRVDPGLGHVDPGLGRVGPGLGRVDSGLGRIDFGLGLTIFHKMNPRTHY